MFEEGSHAALLLGRYHELAAARRVCLRLARPRDARGIADLCRAQGLEPDDLGLARLVRFDPRRRLVVCATALIDSRETIVGVGEIDFGDGPETAPGWWSSTSCARRD